MPLGRKNRGTTHLTAKMQSLSDSNKSTACHGATGLHYWRRILVHKTGSGSSQFFTMYCLASPDSSLQQSEKHSFLHHL